MFCENCGKQIPDGQSLCPACAGQSAPQVEPGETQVLDHLTGYMPMAYQHQQQAQPAYQAPQQPAYQQPAYQAPQQPAYQQSAYQAPQQPAYQAPQQPAYQQPAYEMPQPSAPKAPEQPAFEVSRPANGKKKSGKSGKGGKGGKSGLIIGAVVLVAIVVVVALCWNSITRFFTRNFGDPVDYMVQVESDNAAAAVSTLTDAYGTALERMQKTDSVAAEAAITVEVGDSIMTLLETALSQEGMTLELDWLDEVNVTASSNVKGEKYAMDLGIGVNGTNVITASVIVDTETMNVYMAVPELNKTYLVANMEDFDMDAEEFRAALEQSSQLTQTMVEALPPAEELEELINSYIVLVLEQLEDVEKTTETVEVDGLEQKLMVLSVDLSQKDILNIAEAVMEQARDDKALLGILDDISDMVNNMPDAYETVDLRADFVSSVEYALEELEYAREDAESKTFLTLETYVDNDDQIVGRKVTVKEDGERMELSYVTVTEGDKFAFEADLMEVTAEGSGTVKGDKYTGEFVVTASDMDLVTVEVKDLGTSEDGVLSGTLRVFPEAALMSEMGMDESVTALLGGSLGLELTLGDTVEVSILAGGDVLLGLAASVTETESTAISTPEGAVSINDNEGGMDWVANITFDQLISNLEKAGVPSEYVDMVNTVAQMFAAEFQ